MKHIPTLILGLTLTTTVVVLATREAVGPEYRNRALSSWLDDLNADEPRRVEETEAAIRAIGVDALPVLRKRLRERDSLTHKLIQDFDTILPPSLQKSADARYTTALRACRVLVAIGDETVDPLVAVLSGTNYLRVPEPPPLSGRWQQGRMSSSRRCSSIETTPRGRRG